MKNLTSINFLIIILCFLFGCDDCPSPVQTEDTFFQGLTYDFDMDKNKWLTPSDSIIIKFNKPLTKIKSWKIFSHIYVTNSEENVYNGNSKNLAVQISKIINPQDSTELIIFKEGGFPALYASDKSTLLTEYTNYQLFVFIPNYKVDYLANNRIFYVYEEQ